MIRRPNGEYNKDTASIAWEGLVGHGWRPVRTDGAVTTFVRGRSTAPPPFSGPTRGDAIFCGGWFPQDQLGHQMSDSHATLLVYGEGFLRLWLGSPQPLAVSISVDGRAHSTRTVPRLFGVSEARIGLSGERWHLIALDMGQLPTIRGKPRGVRVLSYALP